MTNKVDTPPLLIEIARECIRVIYRAHAELGDTLPFSYLDLCADNIDAPLADLKSAIVVAGFDYKQTIRMHV